MKWLDENEDNEYFKTKRTGGKERADFARTFRERKKHEKLGFFRCERENRVMIAKDWGKAERSAGKLESWEKSGTGRWRRWFAAMRL
ncbi:hypothetical protein AMTR_s00080p00151560 [Amborella trichopoda]|uniref:Uncharacterized protein n=1 Tax=Amborella trichopoda TaxID=13333 RepID=W1PD28_AMBTC|nr:hypothetical protein AMTR_s00080p00151560 [Amborella trichopoda]